MTETPIPDEPQRPALRAVPDADPAETAAPAPEPDEGPADQDEEVREQVPVDPPVRAERTSLADRARTGDGDKRSPVLAPWLRDRSELRAVTRWAAGYAGHTAAFHTARSPLYAARLAGRSPRGAARLVRSVGAWALDAEAAPLRRDAVDRADVEEYMHLARLRRDRVRLRVLLLIPVLFAVVVVAGMVAAAGSALALVLAVAAAVGGLGALGAKPDRPLVGRAVTTQKAPRLTSDLVVRALAALGIAQINAAVGPKGTGISFPAPIVRDGPGWRAEVDLPYGVTVEDIMDRRDKLASGLRRPLGCVWPEPAQDEHAGRLVLWVGDQAMNKATPATYPLAKTGTVDLFKPVPFGTDQRGRPVRVGLMFANALIGAMPRMGKTFAVRVLALAAALDATVQLRAFELKGTGDLSPIECVAHHYGSGADEATLEAAMASARELYGELESRAKQIRKLPREVCPENKVTAELAARRSLGLFPVVFVLDEAQELFSHPDYKDEADRVFTALVKRGPAMGIICLLATQRPDAKSLPTGVSANAGLRFCLRVMGQTENDMVLGTSMYKNGVRATTLTAKDKGIGYLVGATDDPLVARSYYIDGPTADRVAARARTLREKAGTLSGHAIGQTDHDGDAPRVSLLDDLAAVTAPGEDKVWSETLCDRLAALRPEVYDGWRPAQLAAALKPYGLTTRQVWGTDPATGEGRNRYGLHRTDLLAAIRKRDQRDGQDGPKRGDRAEND